VVAVHEPLSCLTPGLRRGVLQVGGARGQFGPLPAKIRLRFL
jgi:hypothetical protein